MIAGFMQILPDTPLSTVIAEHKARAESGEDRVLTWCILFTCRSNLGLLQEKLGAQASWDALWEKLQHYLSQLRFDNRLRAPVVSVHIFPRRILANSLLDSHPTTNKRRSYGIFWGHYAFSLQP